MKLQLLSPRNRGPGRNWRYYLLVLFIAGLLSNCGSRFDPVAQSKKAESAENLRQLWSAMEMYSHDSKGKFPSLSPERGQLVMDPEQIYPKYLSDPKLYISPAHPDAKKLAALDDPKTIMRDHSYWYLGYAFPDEEDALTFVEEYRRHALEGTPLPDSMRRDSGAYQFKKLDVGVSRFLITDINSTSMSNPAVLLMIERPGLHNGGSNVLFLDGHVEFMEYPGRFPMTERFIQALESLDDLK